MSSIEVSPNSLSGMLQNEVRVAVLAMSLRDVRTVGNQLETLIDSSKGAIFVPASLSDPQMGARVNVTV